MARNRQFAAPFRGFWRLEAQRPASGFFERALDGDDPGRDLDMTPGKGEKLAAAQSRGYRQGGDRINPAGPLVTRQTRQEGGHRLPVEDRELAFRNTRRMDRGGDIARQHL